MNPVPREHVLFATEGNQPGTAAFVVVPAHNIGEVLRYRAGAVGTGRVLEVVLNRECQTVLLESLTDYVVCVRRLTENGPDIEYAMAILNTVTLCFKEVWAGTGGFKLSGTTEIQTTMRYGKSIPVGFKHPSISGSVPFCNSTPSRMECSCHRCRIPQNWSKTRFTYQCRHCEQRAMLETESIYSLLHRAQMATGTKAECIDKVVGKAAPGMYCEDCKTAVRAYNFEALRVMFACFKEAERKTLLPAVPPELAYKIVSLCVSLVY